jgi:hypothetical protein
MAINPAASVQKCPKTSGTVISLLEPTATGPGGEARQGDELRGNSAVPGFARVACSLREPLGEIMRTARLTSLDFTADIHFDFAPMLVVGRHPSCDLLIESGRVSQFHCCLSLFTGEVMVRDLASTNGTRINGHRVHAGRLRDGDELSIAQFRYRLEFHENEVEDGELPPFQNAVSKHEYCVGSGLTSS